MHAPFFIFAGFLLFIVGLPEQHALAKAMYFAGAGTFGTVGVIELFRTVWDAWHNSQGA